VIEDAYVSQVEAERGNNYGSEADQHLIKDDENESSKWIYFKYDLSNAYDNPVSAILNFMVPFTILQPKLLNSSTRFLLPITTTGRKIP
jgi:hypothetical protein